MTEPPSAHDLRRVVAHDAIRQLPHRYAAAIEKRDTEAMARLFVPHATFGAYGAGRRALIRLMADSLSGAVVTVILVTNHLIEMVDDERATGQVWALCYAQTEADGFVEQLIKYEDDYERYDGQWAFRRRRHRLWFGVARADSPLCQGPALWPRRQVGVGDIPLADPAFERWWHQHGEGMTGHVDGRRA